MRTGAKVALILGATALGGFVVVKLLNDVPPDGAGDEDGPLTPDQLQQIMPHLSADLAGLYLPYLNAAMREAEITTSERVAAFVAQLAHESAELRYFEEQASGAEYEGRLDLGNTHDGDGVRYKGRGPIQLTGRANYRAAGKALGLELEAHPEQAMDLEVAFRIAAWYWTTHNLNALADAGDFDKITKAINGGYNGKASRDAYYARAQEVLS